MNDKFDEHSDGSVPKSTPRQIIITGESQITVNKKWVAIIVAILVVFTSVVGWMFQISATSRPPMINTGGYSSGN